ncbi:type I glyceraldehyde-3-phosphate dehydrogenase [Turicimonas muris]|uniref:type I glyceraldehyde-3-phosphate dehydrogenase n=1 Tax=Turicimonas muris TaxID=1796652 RepID=UPI001EC5F427|nr:type I glyceraldehyde-3-phosphate dehydrogenase [Turicimonas muris]MBS4767442.1 type I glyceraldehyde-3-phosphate dehydrogenase [Burkholderiales bacterium]MBS4847344.1 type I glyceraldehyde-3-phosphate dehydrogenase [Burkholderiales bacterium]
MTIRVAITGYGRIGRMVLRAFYEEKKWPDMKIVAINDTAKPEATVHLTKFDTAHGRFNGDVAWDDGYLVVNGDRIKMVSERDPRKLPWKDLDIDIVLECTGAFRDKESCMAHIEAGAKKVLIACPGKNVDATIVYGVNQDVLKASDVVVSNASCTTNCLAPFVKPLMEKIGIEDGMMTTVHAFTNDQVLTDVKHKDLRRARAAGHNIIPTKTGAAKAVGEVIPEMKGKLDGYAMRVPTINVSVCDLTFNATRPTTVEEVNKILKEASESKELKGILGYNEMPLVSSDFNHSPYSSIFDATLTKVIDGTLVKAVAWYDNEWGFSNRMLDTATAMYNAK